MKEPIRDVALELGYAIYRRFQRAATARTSQQINIGKLPRLSDKRVRVPCKDCGQRAEVYDHRDYTAPLQVDPVCQSCNIKRGTATLDVNHVLECIRHGEWCIFDTFGCLYRQEQEARDAIAHKDVPEMRPCLDDPGFHSETVPGVQECLAAAEAEATQETD